VSRHPAPMLLIEIVDTIGERKLKPTRRMTLPVMFSNPARLGEKFSKWFDVWHEVTIFLALPVLLRVQVKLANPLAGQPRASL
jgi:hypothetical protein